MATPLPLLARVLNTPDLPKIVPRLQPDVLHRIIQTCGLEDCSELVALATPDQLARILDLDVWRVRARGGDEEFDADRFGTWIEVLMQSGAAVATEKLIGLDIELVITGFARHARVRDHAAVSSYTTLDGEHVPGRATNRWIAAEIGGYLIEARRTSAWDAIVDLLGFLGAEHPEYFHRLMRGCVRVSNGLREKDGLHDLLEQDEQQMFDLACGREGRRERQGYVTPAQAHAFLQAARDLRLDGDPPPRSAIADAYFRAFELPLPTDSAMPRESGGALPESVDEASREPESDGVAAIFDMLREAGVLAPQPRALLGGVDGQTSRLASIEAYAASHVAGAEELAYLANTIFAGCSIQRRPFTPHEAADGAAAICNLGLENWPSQWPDRDLVTAFQVGWAILHRDVCMYAAEHLVDVLADIQCSDRDIHVRLDGLRRQLIRHVRDREPWRARDALDAIMMLDPPSWAALLALIDEFPVMHAALSASRLRVRSINPTDFAFISENSQIAAVREFMVALPSVLTS
jgi:hypothetical protein